LSPIRGTHAPHGSDSIIGHRGSRGHDESKRRQSQIASFYAQAQQRKIPAFSSNCGEFPSDPELSGRDSGPRIPNFVLALLVAPDLPMKLPHLSGHIALKTRVNALMSRDRSTLRRLERSRVEARDKIWSTF
jgi:hypothetical protein